MMMSLLVPITACVLSIVALVITIAKKKRSLLLAFFCVVIVLAGLMGAMWSVQSKNAFGILSCLILCALGINLTRQFKSLDADALPTLLVRWDGNEYDLASWAKNHPGGDVIWEADGQDVVEFWKKRGQLWHRDSENVRKIMEQYRLP